MINAGINAGRILLLLGFFLASHTGGVNPSSHQVVDVALGEEYITSLTFDPASVTVTQPIPAPASWLLLGTGFAAAMRSKAVGKTRSKRQRPA